MDRIKPYKQQGTGGVPIYAGYVLSPEKSPKLIGQEKYRTFSDVMTNTSIIAAGVRYFLNIVARPSWSCEAADDSEEAKGAAEFIEEVLLEKMHTPWSRVVRRMGTYRFYGFSIQEWQAKKREDGKVGIEDIESRPQWTVWRWEVDERGVVTGMWQRDPLTGRELGIPRGKVIYLVDDTLTDSPEGLGLLRHCIEPAFRLEEYQKQENFGFLRDLRGVPIGRAPLDELHAMVASGAMTQGQVDTALQQLTNLVSLEAKDKDTAIMLNSQPYLNQSADGQSMASQYKWGVELVNGNAPGLEQVGAAISRLNYEIARILGVEGLLLGSEGAGSLAMSQDKSSHLYLLANSVLRDIRLQAENDLIKPIWSLNGFDDKLMPKLKSEDVAPKDAEMVAKVLADMAMAGTPMTPADEAQNAVRDLLGIPHVDLEDVQNRMDSLGDVWTDTHLGVDQSGGQEGAGATTPVGGSGGAMKKRSITKSRNRVLIELDDVDVAA